MAAPEPRSTYRVQLHAGFTFDDAAAIASYLSELGISHLYCSPYQQAAPGSTHGYDVVDHSRLNAELGGPEGHRRMSDALHGAGLGQLLDIVPNHMAIDNDNRWWWDVLENGPSSPYAGHFDVDWDPPESKLRNRVLVPILGDHYGRVLEAGEIRLVRDGGTFRIEYYEHRLPVAPRSLDTLLHDAARRGGSAELAFIARSYRRLPPATSTDRQRARERHQDKEVLGRRLTEVLAGDDRLAAAVDAAVAAVNADPDALDAVLEQQNFRLARWRTAGSELDYRRFFDINTLVALRMEDPAVFDDTHDLVLRLYREGVVHGFRVDHPDGLRDPEAYMARLADATNGGWIVVEKIVEPGERLPSTWPVDGTTGYDWLNRANGLFVDATGEALLTELYGELTGETTDYHAVVHDTKQLVMRAVLGSDVNRLTELLVRIVERRRRYRDYTRHDLHAAVRELIANFPVYRTYIRAASDVVVEQDVAYVDQAVAGALAHRPDVEPELFDFLRDLLLLRLDGDLESEFVMRFQQVTGPVMAKGVEDTAFYNYLRLVSLNEVGGDPGRFGVAVGEFHAASAEAQRDWPRSLLATSTHDTKRSEDVRARINLLSEMPEEWATAVRRWCTTNLGHRPGADLPDRNAEYLLYQTLVGAWPLPADRATRYMEKATKEAKAHTSWIDPVAEYDDALRSFVESVLADEAFVADVAAFVEPLVRPGRVNSLAQVLLKLTSPGVGDTYQGQELWDLSLVDPDNRRPVDYDLRRRLLASLQGAKAADVWSRDDEGSAKLLVTTRALHAGIGGGYVPLTASGPAAGHVVAFARGDRHVTLVPRLVLGLERAGGWRDTVVELPDGAWRNLFTDEVAGGAAPLVDVLHDFPVALLERA